MDIGPPATESVVVNPVAIPTERLQPSLEGYWLHVLVAASHVKRTQCVHDEKSPLSGRPGAASVGFWAWYTHTSCHRLFGRALRAAATA